MSIFINNKYTNWYFSIISNARTRTIPTNTYVERHHIVPKSLGGSNDKNNLVVLNAREHLICHWLLTKMVMEPQQKRKMFYALHAMSFLQNGKRYINTRAYEKAKAICAELRRADRKGISVGEKNYNFGNKWTDEQRNKMSEYRKGKCFRKNFEYSEETRNKMMESAAKRWTVEERERFGQLRKKNMKSFTCEQCGKLIAGVTNYNRWHGDNCKRKLDK